MPAEPDARFHKRGCRCDGCEQRFEEWEIWAEAEGAEGDTPGPLEEAYGRDVVAQDRLTSLQAGLKAEVETLRKVAGVFANAKPSAVEHPLVQQAIKAFAAQQDRLENLLRESEGEA